ncbi:MAG: hypothetical protein VCE43_19295 [Myxococcota bacterium]
MGIVGLVERKGPIALGGIALAIMVGAMLHLAGRPLSTDDFWWHLKMGEFYATDGLDLAADPISFTAKNAPEPHQWLFGVALHSARQIVGLQGLRALHVMLVAGIVWLAFSSFRRASASTLMACGATSAWLAMSWWRLFQFRPDLLSIAATLVIYRLLFEAWCVDAATRAGSPNENPPVLPVAPSWARVGVAVAVLVVWANSHALFAIGPALIVAALLGCALMELLRIGVVEPQRSDWSVRAAPSSASIAPRLAAALGVGLIATLLNPRGIDQHLTFFKSAGSSALWRVRDEWTHFSPIDPGGYGPAMSPVSFLTTDAVMAGFAIAAGFAFWRLAQRRDHSAIDLLGPVAFGLGLAGIVAMAVAVRFLWMGVFPLLYLVRFFRVRELARAADPRASAETRTAWGCAVLTALIAVGFFRAPNYQAALNSLPAQPSQYLTNAFDRDKYYQIGVDFLRETGLQGRLFNSYAMGGFVAYWLSPALLTFIDGRMNFPAEALRDYKTVTLQRASSSETFLDVLDRRRVDVFFGVGVPTGPRNTETTLYTTASLERGSNWRLVSRSMRHSIYLRNVPNHPQYQQNLDRVDAYYRAEGVPFDRHVGFDISRVIAERPDWAVRHNLLPNQYESLLTAARSTEPAVRAAGLEGLGISFALNGAYREQLAVDSVAVTLRPRAKAPLRRMIYGLLRLDQPNRAVEAAERLIQLDPADRRSRAFANAANAYLEDSRAVLRDGRHRGVPPDALINVLPLLDD